MDQKEYEELTEEFAEFLKVREAAKSGNPSVEETPTEQSLFTYAPMQQENENPLAA